MLASLFAGRTTGALGPFLVLASMATGALCGCSDDAPDDNAPTASGGGAGSGTGDGTETGGSTGAGGGSGNADSGGSGGEPASGGAGSGGASFGHVDVVQKIPVSCVTSSCTASAQ